MAAALADERGLAAIHIIAHGAPGRVNFTAGEWSAETLAEEAEDLAAIGQALGAGRMSTYGAARLPPVPRVRPLLRVWRGRAAPTSPPASGRVGAAALGGGWELTAPLSLR